MAFWRLVRIACLVVLTTAACQKLGLTKQYEYDERIELSLDGSAVLDVNASIPALVALRGATLSTDPMTRFDRREFRHLYEGPGVTVREVTPFRRHGRRFVHVRVEVSNISELSRLAPLSWSQYQLERLDREFRFTQLVGRSAGVQLSDVGWDGSELVAFRVHLPSRIRFHNSPLGVERGNTLAWEQPLTDRLAGAPVQMEARVDTESILYTTLLLFGSTFVAAIALLALVIWWVSRRGRKNATA